MLEFGASGGLRSAPALNGVLLSAEQRAQADRIIQAAIQCAPYGGGHVENTTITLVPDFAAVHPRVGVSGSDNE